MEPGDRAVHGGDSDAPPSVTARCGFRSSGAARPSSARPPGGIVRGRTTPHSDEHSSGRATKSPVWLLRICPI
jgi:hypothetical protein